MQSARSLLCLAGLSLVAVAAQAKPLIIPHVMVTSAGQCVVFDAVGGYLGIGVDTTPAPVWVKKNLGNVKYNEFTVQCMVGVPGGLLGPLTNTFGAGQPQPQSFDFTLTSPLTDKVGIVRSFTGWTLSSFTIPACNVNGTVPKAFTVTLTGGTSPVTGQVPYNYQNFTLDKIKQKPWLPANFRLSITGSDCSRVAKVEAITVKQTLASFSSDGTLGYYLDGDDMVFTMPVEDAAPFIAELASAGKGVAARTGELDLLDEKGRVLNAFGFTGMHVVGAEPVFNARSSGHAVEKVTVVYENFDMK
jgi:hypothetical protein